MTTLPVRMARWSAGRPWRAIAGWFLFVALCLGIGISIGGNAATSEDFRIGEAGRAEAMAAEGGLRRTPVERLLITRSPGAAPWTGRRPPQRAASERPPRDRHRHGHVRAY